MSDLLRLILNEFKLVFKKKKHVLLSIFLCLRRFVRRGLNLKAEIGNGVWYERSGSQARRNVTGPFVGAIMVRCEAFAARFAL